MTDLSENVKACIAEGLKQLKLPASAAEKLIAYGALLLETNQSFNLLGNVAEQDLAIKHLLDSLAAVKAAEKAVKVLDMGSGGGLPGIPLAICCPDTRFVLADATAKKVDFINKAAEFLGLDNVKGLCGRAEELAGGAERESFDLCVSRAMAAMDKLAEYCLPFVKVGGRLIAYKGPKAAEELAEARGAIRVLGGGNARVEQVQIPYLEGERNLICIDKVKQTPPAYPRTNAQIKNKPLR